MFIKLLCTYKKKLLGTLYLMYLTCCIAIIEVRYGFGGTYLVAWVGLSVAKGQQCNCLITEIKYSCNYMAGNFI